MLRLLDKKLIMILHSKIQFRANGLVAGQLGLKSNGPLSQLIIVGGSSQERLDPHPMGLLVKDMRLTCMRLISKHHSQSVSSSSWDQHCCLEQTSFSFCP